jgi:hypothetical protein
MEAILKAATVEPVSFTYLGIGSAPYIGPEKELDGKVDQILPLCFREFLHAKRQMRIIHFDPCFANCGEFLQQYFEKLGLLPMDCAFGYHWIGEAVEVFILPERIQHEEQYWFFESLTKAILETGGRLVIQEYTGYSQKELSQKLYNASPNKEHFKRRILLDMTYGTDSGCMTDMTKARPFYDSSFNFINLHHLTDTEAVHWIGHSPELNSLLQKIYSTKILSALNNIHVDYRRKLRGESCMFGSSDYSDESSADDIMKVLQNELHKCFNVLSKINCMEKERMSAIQTLFENYKTHDPYKWYDAVRKMLLPPI